MKPSWLLDGHDSPDRGKERRRTSRGALRGTALLILLAVFCTLTSRADEPYARSRDYDLQHARITLQFDAEQRKVIGEVTHTLTPMRDSLTRLAFDSVGLSILSVAVSGKPAKFEVNPAQVVVTLNHPAKSGEKLEVTIRYEGRPKRGLYFVLPDKNYPNRPKEIWTQGEAEETRYYIPIYDYPNDRLTTEMIVTVPRDWQTVSNGKLVRVSDAAYGMKTWHWRESLPHSSYLISLVAGEFAMTSEAWHGIPVTNYVPRDRADHGTVTVANTRKMLDFYSDALGIRYPWEKYAQAWVDEFVAGGMENTSATTNTASSLLHPQLAGETLKGVDDLIAHEVAHQWFGDLVTCKDWANIWLNEGFATYFETLWEEHEYGTEEAAYSLWQNRNTWMNNSRLYAVPIVTRNFSDATEYAGNIYGKAGWVLHMLRLRLGNAGFFRAMKHYLEVNRGQNVVTADLAKAIEQATGVNVDQFFDEWIYGAGAPGFQVSYSYDESARQVRLSVEQAQKVEGRVGLFHVPVDVEITTASGKKNFPIEISKTSESFTFPVDGPPRMLLFDKGNTILKSIEFNKPASDWIYQLKYAQTVPDRADAAKALGDIRESEEVIAALGQAGVSDPFWGIRVEAVRALGRIGGPAAQLQSLRALANDKPWVRQVVVEQLGSFRGDPTIAAKLENIYREDKTYRVRNAALTSLAQQKGANAFELLRAAAATESPDDRLRIAALRGLGALGDDRASPILLEWSATGKPFAVRSTAISSLGRLDKKNKAVTERLIAYLAEPYRSVRFATLQALGQRGDPAAIAPLETLLKSGTLSPRMSEFAKTLVERLKQAAADAGEK